MSKVKIETTTAAVFHGRRYVSAKAAAVSWSKIAMRRLMIRRRGNPENKPAKSFPSSDIFAKDPAEYEKQLLEYKRSWAEWDTEECKWERRTRQRFYAKAYVIFRRYLHRP